MGHGTHQDLWSSQKRKRHRREKGRPPAAHLPLAKRLCMNPAGLLFPDHFLEHSLWREQIDDPVPCRFFVLTEVVVVPSYTFPVTSFQPDATIAVPPAVFAYRYQDRVWPDPICLAAVRPANALQLLAQIGERFQKFVDHLPLLHLLARIGAGSKYCFNSCGAAEVAASTYSTASQPKIFGGESCWLDHWKIRPGHPSSTSLSAQTPPPRARLQGRLVLGHGFHLRHNPGLHTLSCTGSEGGPG